MPEQNSIRRENTFLRDCTRYFLQPGGSVSIPQGLDWIQFLALAKEHSVEPAIYSVLRDQALPEGAGNELGASFHRTARANLALTAGLVKLLALFEQGRIDVLTLKGPVLAEALYGSIALRTFSDLDLLVRPADVLRAKSLLESHGYAATTTPHWRSDRAYLRSRDSQISFAGADGASVDIHWRLLPDYFPKAVDENRVWSSRRAVTIGGAAAWTLSPEHLLMFLCAHGTKHLWERLGWIADVARLLQVEKNIDWSYVFAEADRTYTSRLLSLGLLLSSDLSGFAAPERARSDQNAALLADWIRRRFMNSDPIPASTLKTAWFSTRVFERRGQRLRYALELFFGPTEADYRALPLPPSSHAFYYIFRPLRLGARAVGLGR